MNSDYPYTEMIVDNCAMQCLKNPYQFDMMICPNLFGGIISGVLTGLINGPGYSPGYYRGPNHTIYTGDLRFSSYKNPIGHYMSLAKLFKHQGMQNYEQKIHKAVNKTLEETSDIFKYAELVLKNLN